MHRLIGDTLKIGAGGATVVLGAFCVNESLPVVVDALSEASELPTEPAAHTSTTQQVSASEAGQGGLVLAAGLTLCIGGTVVIIRTTEKPRHKL